MVKYLKGQNTPVSDLEGNVNIESDCEGGSSDVTERKQKAKEENGEETHAVLITGSFSAYALFYPASFSVEMTGIPQLEISLLLPLHRRNPVCTPKITRCRYSFEFHPRKDSGDGTPSLLSEEHLRSG